MLSIAVVIFWLTLVTDAVISCPEECRCNPGGFQIRCYGPSLAAVPLLRLTDTRKLALYHNNIRSIERDSFVTLTELEELSVRECGLRTIELGAFNGLTKLTTLTIRGNEINEIIPGTFENMISLVRVDLRENRLELLNSGVFSGLVNLHFVYLQTNKLQYIHPDTFFGLPNLKHIILSGNVDLHIPTVRPFINSPSLSFLDISSCNVGSVSAETFAKVSALEKLDLSFNKLRSVDINILRALPKLSTFYLYPNPLHYDCQLQEVRRWCEDRNIENVYERMEPECDTPSEVEGMWWRVLDTWECIQNNIEYCGNYKDTSYSYNNIEGTYTRTETDRYSDTVRDKYEYYERETDRYYYYETVTDRYEYYDTVTDRYEYYEPETDRYEYYETVTDRYEYYDTY
jgi:hypothetical protein